MTVRTLTAPNRAGTSHSLGRLLALVSGLVLAQARPAVGQVHGSVRLRSPGMLGPSVLVVTVMPVFSYIRKRGET
jgi:hypothetical protein